MFIRDILSIILIFPIVAAIATIIYFQILQTSGATFISIMNYLIPVWAIIFGVIFFAEQVTSNYIIGLIVIILGIQLSQTNQKQGRTTL
mgnify:CR=1 FL=1